MNYRKFVVILALFAILAEISAKGSLPGALERTLYRKPLTLARGLAAQDANRPGVRVESLAEDGFDGQRDPAAGPGR